MIGEQGIYKDGIERKRIVFTVEPLYNEVLGITNDFLYPSKTKIYGKEPRYDINKTSLNRTYFASPLALPHRGSTVYEC